MLLVPRQEIIRIWYLLGHGSNRTSIVNASWVQLTYSCVTNNRDYAIIYKFIVYIYILNTCIYIIYMFYVYRCWTDMLLAYQIQTFPRHEPQRLVFFVQGLWMEDIPLKPSWAYMIVYCFGWFTCIHRITKIIHTYMWDVVPAIHPTWIKLNFLSPKPPGSGTALAKKV